MGSDPSISMRLWQLMAWILLYLNLCPLASALISLFVSVESAAQGEAEKVFFGLGGGILTGLLPLLVTLLAIPVGFPSTRKRFRRLRKPLAWSTLVLVSLIMTGWLLLGLVSDIALGQDQPYGNLLSGLVCGIGPFMVYGAMVFALSLHSVREDGQRISVAGGSYEHEP